MDRSFCSFRVLAVAVVCTTRIAAGENSPVAPLARTIREAANVQRAVDTMSKVYSTDRWFTFPKFEETATYLKSRLQESGLTDIEIDGAAADGHTQAGFWTMPLAWDVKAARLEVTSPEKMVLCDYERVPTCLGMWSGPTPAGGIDAELVDLRNTPWEQVKGKIVLTDKNPASLKYELVKYKAIGAVNAFTENPDLLDGRQWINAWGDSGWGYTKTSTPLLCYSVTPRQTTALRKILAEGKKITLHAVADTRYYEGRYPYVTGVLPGTDRTEEVLVLGHTSEQGAQDNATGVAANIEALATLNKLIESGKLARPRRTIRVLLMPELYGSLTYITKHQDRMRNTIAAMTVDTPAASYDLAGTEYTLYSNPHVAKSWTDALILRITQASLPGGRPWHVSEHTTGTDAYLGEPTVGVPDVWAYSGTGVVTHHNSEDKPETVDPRSMRDLISIIGTYLYYCAGAGEREAPWLADITLDRALVDMQSAASTAIDSLASGDKNGAAFELERVPYFADRGRDAILSLLRLVPEAKRTEIRRSLEPILTEVNAARDSQLSRLRNAGAQTLARKVNPDAEAIIVRRKRLGTIPMDDIPRDRWQGYPSGAWDKLVTVALYWCDGKRNLSEVIHLTEMEMGHPSDFDFVGYFRFLKQLGYVDFAK
jgi:Peptidase family M28